MRLILLAALVLSLFAGADAQSWKAKYPEITFAVVPQDNARTTNARWSGFANYLSGALGVKVTLRTVQDYAAVIEGQRAGHIQIAFHGAASFARARLTGVAADAFATDLNADGDDGYYSVYYTLARSPYRRLEDLRGKTLALVDPNSTSGNSVPRYELFKKGIALERYFGRTIYAGSHENALYALAQGTVDAAINQWGSDDDSTLQQMLNQHMLKKPDGTAYSRADFRIVHKSQKILNGPYCLMSALPAEMKTAVKAAFFESPKRAPAAFAAISDGRRKGFVAVSNKDYDYILAMSRFIDTERRRRMD